MSNIKWGTPKADIPGKLYGFLAGAAFVLLLLLWSLLTYSGYIPPLFLPTPSAVVQGAILLFGEFHLIDDIIASVLRVSAGFLVAAVIGVPLGVLMGSLKIFEAFF